MAYNTSRQPDRAFIICQGKAVSNLAICLPRCRCQFIDSLLLKASRVSVQASLGPYWLHVNQTLLFVIS